MILLVANEPNALGIVLGREDQQLLSARKPDLGDAHFPYKLAAQYVYIPFDRTIVVVARDRNAQHYRLNPDSFHCPIPHSFGISKY
ncbi:MAG: hypothetical protein K0Q94_3395 [Paenibacillus sp.]|jgi:hypothetical protein|nr:hypothetical protein [Paenibacillus sp.]